MANYNSLKATVNANIKANNNQEITGPILNSVLTQMIESMGVDFPFADVYYKIYGSPTVNGNVVRGKFLYYDGSVGDHYDYVYGSDFIPVVVGDVIHWYYGVPGSGMYLNIVMYDADKTPIGYYAGIPANERTVTLARQNVAYIRCSFGLANLQGAFVSVNGVKVWQPFGAEAGLGTIMSAIAALSLPISVDSSSNGWQLSGNGLARRATGAIINKYRVTPGDALYLKINDDFPNLTDNVVAMFASDSFVPSLGTNANVVGDIYRTGIDRPIIVPDGATWLLVSQLTSSVNQVRSISGFVSSLTATREQVESIVDMMRSTLVIYPYANMYFSFTFDGTGVYLDISGFNIRVAGTISEKTKAQIIQEIGQSGQTIHIPYRNGLFYNVLTRTFSVKVYYSSRTDFGDVLLFSAQGENSINYVYPSLVPYYTRAVMSPLEADLDGAIYNRAQFVPIALSYSKGNLGAPDSTYGAAWYNRFNIIHSTDYHNGFGQISEMLKVIQSRYLIRALIDTGDNTNGYGINQTNGAVTPKADVLASLRQGRDLLLQSPVPVLTSLGNHDANGNTGNAYPSTYQVALTKADQWDNYFAAMAAAYPATIYGDAANYRHFSYTDFSVYWGKIRVIMLDSLDVNNAVDANGNLVYNLQSQDVYSQAQIDWLVNDALNVPADTQVIICNHFPFTPTVGIANKVDGAWDSLLIDGTFPQGWRMIPEIVRAWKNRASLTRTYPDTVGNQPITVAADFSSIPSSCDFIAFLCGHTHYKWAQKVPDFPEITMVMEDTLGNIGTAFSRVAMVANTVNNIAFSMLSIDGVQRKIYRTAYGRFLGSNDPQKGRVSVIDY